MFYKSITQSVHHSEAFKSIDMGSIDTVTDAFTSFVLLFEY